MKKIMIIGSGGSGKTTLAKQLAEKLDLPVHHLDNYFWQPGWEETHHDDFVEKQFDLVEQDRWIIDGNYIRTWEIRLHEADTIIFLDIPRWRCLYQAIKRQFLFHKKNRPDLPEGCPSRFDRKFFLFLWYMWRYKIVFRPYILRYIELLNYSDKLYHITSYAQLKSLIT
jgi:adenylate kinase family enzyme